MVYPRKLEREAKIAELKFMFREHKDLSDFD